jgi:hypothetical protein
METTTSSIVNFGKHNGKSLSQISQEDIKWVIWLSQNYDVYANYSPNRYVRLKQETINYRTRLKQEAIQLAKAYFNQIEEANKQSSTSQWIGTLGKRETFALTVKKIKSGYDYTKIIAIDENGNEIFFYDKDYNLEVNQSIEVTGTPTKHTESLGIKQTYINRTKIK